MFRSALNAFFVLTLASLGLVSYLTAHRTAPARQRVAAQFVPVSAPARPAALGGEIELVADHLGHYAANVEVEGRKIHMLVDTGASFVSLTSDDAETLGLSRSQADFKMRLSTANGIVRAAPIHLSQLRIGSIEIDDVDALILPPGALAQSLLGMSALNKLSSFAVSTGRLVLRQ